MTRRLLLLGILLQGDMHGYQLNDYVSHAMGPYTDLKRPTAYYTLEKLEKDGCVQRETVREGRRPERHVYRITEKGRALFVDLLRSNLSSFTHSLYADDFGVAFMDQVPDREARRLLADKRDKVRAVLEQLQKLPGHGGNWRHVVTHNIAHLEAEVAWLDGLLSEPGEAEP